MLCDGWGLPCCLATTLAAGQRPGARPAAEKAHKHGDELRSASKVGGAEREEPPYG
jgi:hypothetical protein